MKKILKLCIAFALCTFLTISVVATNFTPSVEYKPAPELSTITDVEGNEVTAIITDSNGNQSGLPERIEIVITPTSDKEATLTPEIQEMLKRAEDQITQAENLGELTHDLSEALAELKASEKNSVFQNVALEDLVVQYLFDVSFVRDGKVLEDLLRDGETVTFALKTQLTEDDLYFVLHNYEDDLWEVVKNVTIDNGVMTITLGSLSPIAIVVDGGSVLAVNDEGPASPQTGTKYPVEYLIAAAVLACVSGILLYRGKKQTTN